MLEWTGAYLIARTTILDEKAFLGTTKLILLLLSILAPLAVMESVTGIHFIKDIASKLSGNNFLLNIETRQGFARAYGPFDHPILFGVYAASALGLMVYRIVPKHGYPRFKIFPVLMVIANAISSVSSGALAGLMTQLTLIIWERKTRKIRSRWLKLTAIFFTLYSIVGLISNRTAIKVFFTYLTFSEATAYFRIEIFNYGIQNLWDNPIFGIGFNDWIRPTWMGSSMDNFWLVQAVTFGLPGFLTMVLPVLVMLGRNWSGMSERMCNLRIGWTISMIGIIVSATTVHLWNSVFVYFAFLLGMGVWFLIFEEYPISEQASARQ